MIRGVLRNKYALSEDQLTSSVWGMLEFLPPRALLDWIERARPWGNAMREPLRFGAHASAEILFWPVTRAHGEPDLLVLVTSDRTADAVLIEAKHGAGKSQWNALEEEELAQRKHDQLVRYWNALRERDFAGVDARLATARPTVVYLTPHVAPPRPDLDESCQRESSIRLAWLSWRDLDEVLATVEPVERTEGRVLAALRALLAHLGLTSFAGFRGPVLAARVDPSNTWRWDVGRFVRGAPYPVRADLTWSFSR